MAIEKDTLDQVLVGRDPKEVFSKDGLFDELKKALAERSPLTDAPSQHMVCNIR